LDDLIGLEILHRGSRPIGRLLRPLSKHVDAAGSLRHDDLAELTDDSHPDARVWQVDRLRHPSRVRRHPVRVPKHIDGRPNQLLGDANANADSNSNSNSNSDPNAYSHTHSDTDAYSNPNPYAYSDTDTDAYSNSYTNSDTAAQHGRGHEQ
jgi:hypothetical protein